MNHTNFDPCTGISRRSLLSLAALGLVGCGGGVDGLLLAGPPGIGGTGMFATGTITGFGSVIVNGIRFDDTSAAVQIDGVSVLSDDLRLGMVAEVQGARNVDITTGVASQIQVWSIAQGAVSDVKAGQFSVSGMEIATNLNTVFDGINAASALREGYRVVVWGLQAGADGRHWSATRVSLQQSSATLVSTGILAPNRTVNSLELSGWSGLGAATGQLVRVQGVLSASGRGLQVQSVRVLGVAPIGLAADAEVEIEGQVTAILPNKRFTLGSVEIDASSSTVASNVAALVVGQRIEVEGVWQGSVLKATLIEIEDETKLTTASLEAKIDQFTSLSNFVVRGQRCDVSGIEMTPVQASKLRVGTKVKLEGVKAGDVLVVTKIEVKD